MTHKSDIAQQRGLSVGSGAIPRPFLPYLPPLTWTPDPTAAPSGVHRGVDQNQLEVIASRNSSGLAELVYIDSFSARDLANAVEETARLVCENAPAPPGAQLPVGPPGMRAHTRTHAHNEMVYTRGAASVGKGMRAHTNTRPRTHRETACLVCENTRAPQSAQLPIAPGMRAHTRTHSAHTLVYAHARRAHASTQREHARPMCIH